VYQLVFPGVGTGLGLQEQFVGIVFHRRGQVFFVLESKAIIILLTLTPAAGWLPSVPALATLHTKFF